ncbi:hypothetical protein Taro_005369 [Colocasia esculenta]|uniref:Transcription factor CBF/NF-Y/archaeal histone domain-containing protein n=1 Tax=Colocasia esculenta TaxID=4460 RepID=A0A843TPP3_COLES|nr:hypothetical protein [Colocasia esculenta]
MAKKGEERPAVVVEELPRTIVRRIVRDKLSRLSSSSSSSSRGGRRKGVGAAGGEEGGEGDGDGYGMNVHLDAILAFSESARIFIHYLSATANDICRESKRQLINAEDVFKALEEIEFPEFVEPLKVSLEDFRRRNAAKKSGSKPKDKKRKMEGEELHAEIANGGGGEGADGVEREEDREDGDAHDSE